MEQPQTDLQQQYVQKHSETQESLAILKLQQQKKFYLLVMIMLSSFLIYIGVSAMGPIYPDEATKQRHIEQYWVGIVFAINPLLTFIFGFFVVNLMEGRRRFLMYVGLTANLVGFFGFGVIYYIPDDQKTLFLIFSAVSRGLQGFGASFFNVPANAFFPIYWQDTLELKLGLLQTIRGAGLIAGNLLASALFSLGGYTLPFYTNAALLFISYYLMIRGCPSDEQIEIDIANIRKVKQVVAQIIEKKKSLTGLNVSHDLGYHAEQQPAQLAINRNINDTEIQTSGDTFNNNGPVYTQASDQKTPLITYPAEPEKSNREFSMIKILINISILITYLANMFASFGICFLEPTLSPFLLDQFKITQDEAGYFFGVLMVMFALFGLIVGKVIVAKHQLRKVFIFFGLMLGALGNFLIGPDPIIRKIYSPNIPMLLVSLIVLGSGYGMTFVPNMPEQMSILFVMYPKLDLKTIGDIGATLQNSSFSLGQFIGPIVGGFLDSAYGFPRAASILGLAILLLGFSYLINISFRKKVKLTEEQLQLIAKAKGGGE